VNLPADFVNEGLELAATLSVLGVPVETLSRDELLAVAAHGWASYHRSIDDGRRSLELMSSLLRIRSDMTKMQREDA
jgi:hypothetical protein